MKAQIHILFIISFLYQLVSNTAKSNVLGLLSEEAPGIQLRPEVFHCWLHSSYSTVPVALVGQ